jgi:hypothetical protein
MRDDLDTIEKAVDRPAMVAAWRHVDALERSAVDAEQRAKELVPAAHAAQADADHARIRADRAWGALVVVLRAWAVGTPPPAAALRACTASTSLTPQVPLTVITQLREPDPRD